MTYMYHSHKLIVYMNNLDCQLLGVVTLAYDLLLAIIISCFEVLHKEAKI